jgi:rubrerythrin
VKIDKWAPAHLKDHLQFAIDLEFWTIPFYMSALYSIVDRTSDAFRFVQSVMNQEMLHVQLAANVANAYGLHPPFRRRSTQVGRSRTWTSTSIDPTRSNDSAPIPRRSVPSTPSASTPCV